MAWRRFLWLALLLVSGALASGQDNTGWRNPSANEGDFTNPALAYTDGAGFATAAHEAEHEYWGYTISIPAGREIVGIEVLLDVQRQTTRLTNLFVELSWNGGDAWTTTGHVASLNVGGWRRVILGSSTDTWGRTWTPGELTATAFRVVLVAHRPSRVDWVAVRVHHRAAITLTLSVNPQLVDIGTLTIADYDAGFRDIPTSQRLTVSSPASWTLHVAANAATWTYTGTEPPPAKPSTHLEWRVSAFGSGVSDPQTSFLGLTTVQHRVAGGAAGTGLWLDIVFRLIVDYDTTVPGTYMLSFTYTLTSP